MDALPVTESMEVASCFVLGCVTTWALVPQILKWAPVLGGANSRREFHHGLALPVVRLGGAALGAAFVLVALAVHFFSTPSCDPELLAIVLGSIAMFSLGFFDDLRGLDARFKFAMQFVIASGVYFAGIKIDVLKNPFNDIDYTLGGFGFVITILWLVTLTNLINLIDGIDGLAAGICLMLMVLLANLGAGGASGYSMLLSLGVAGALLGFLRYNYPPARIHMGDGGAYFLGFLIGTLSIVNSNKGTVAAALIAPAFALAVPIADVALAVLRRGLRGLPMFRPDQKHIHHHLIRLGFSRERTVLILYTVSSLCLLLAFEVFWLQGRFLPLFSGLLFLTLIASGHLSGFTKDWFSIGLQFAGSRALRKETRYALALSRCLEMEAERTHSMDQLWKDYQLIVSKLGFTRVMLVSPGGGLAWQSDNFMNEAHSLHQARHEIYNGTFIEFSACESTHTEPLFRLLADLSAESWHKAVSRLTVVNHEISNAPALDSSPGFPRGERNNSLHRSLHRISGNHPVPVK
jgi:UDP-GlcNAc:undecaprenyl-phosphate GlcNAc-1-phosphate transferase